ncbi:MAG TPA: nicotinamide-nucleotide amidohydrolase family protein [Burkholderiales bacterium]|nr:nicotinamide-nucleotide amidohydrolase family protein [Burkholderiales bacterium]
MPDTVLYELAERTGRALRERGLMMATAESCTGGWIAEAVTMVPGSSEWFERGFVTYTYISKREMLGVTSAALEQHGAVSQAVVEQMVTGALERSHAQVAVAVSGTAGPSGGTAEKPVGTVCFAWGVKAGAPRSETQYLAGDREAVRRQSVIHALTVLIDIVERQST